MADFKAAGVSATVRNLDLMDVCCAETAAKCGKSLVSMSRQAMKQMMHDVFIDLSQSGKRRVFTKADVTPALTTASCIYSFGRDSIVLPLELLLWHGHNVNVSIPADMSPSSLKELAGEGMALPCLAAVLWSLYLTKQFP
jgi:hypothetical protein